MRLEDLGTKKKPLYWVESDDVPPKILKKGKSASKVIQWAIDRCAEEVEAEGVFPYDGSIRLNGKTIRGLRREGKKNEQ
jgi:hypothetical protein